jgi:K+-sensing histidine kinase KdpD
VDILTIVDYALNDARVAFCGREFMAETPAAPPLVTVDQHLLHVLLMTLLYNGARRRIDDEPVALQIAVMETGLEFAVDDEQAPLPTEIVTRLFEPRPELPRALHLPQFGLGLRLYAARQVARQMGGDLEIVLGRGNVYRLRLPLQPPADASIEANI